MDGIEITIDRIGILNDIAPFRVRGYVDTTTSPELQKLLLQSIEDGIYQFIIDLGFVNYVSSAGWGVFVGEIRGLRERGGDLKIIQMTPEVYEVFEMLEFNRILQSYDTLEEAMSDYEISRGLDLLAASTFRPEPTPSQAAWERETAVDESRVAAPALTVERSAGHRGVYTNGRRPPNEIDLPLTEKIKKLVTENPLMGAWTIKRQLYSPRFGYTRVGFLKLRSMMKRLGLENKAKRYRYYRSR